MDIKELTKTGYAKGLAKAHEKGYEGPFAEMLAAQFASAFVEGYREAYDEYVTGGYKTTLASEAVLYKTQKPSKEQIEEIREAAKRPIVYDDDSPEMTPAAEKAFRLAAVSRSRVLP